MRFLTHTIGNRERTWLLSLLLVVACVLTSFGQAPYVNTIHQGLGVQPVVGATYHKGKIYTASLTSDIQYYNIARFDSTGQFEKEFTFFTDSLRVFQNCAKCVHVHRRSLYHVIGPFLNSNAPYALLYKFNLGLDSIQNVDTLWVPPIDFGLDSTEAIQVRATEFDSDSTFLLTGIVAAQPSPAHQYRYDLFLARVDTNFNVLWMKVVYDNNLLRPYGLIGGDIEIDAYGGIVVTGNPYFWGFQTGFAARFRASDGQLLWKREYTPDLGFGISNMFVVDNQDGTYQYAMNEWSRTDGAANLIRNGTMDTLGNIITSSYFGKRNDTPEPLANWAQDLIRTNDGNYYLAGLGYASTNFGFGAKFTRTGDSLWYREYTHGGWNYVGNLGYPKEQGWIEWFTQKSDSSFLHIGWNINNYSQVVNTWILNTDKYGCDSLGCETIGLEESTLAKAQWRIHPNPTTNLLHISFEASEPLTRSEHFNIQLINMQGQVIFAQEYEASTQGCTLSLGHLPTGVHQLQVWSNGQMVKTEKLLLKP